MKLRILGCGTSTGVPRIGNDWGACDPAEPRNRRSRASILIESDTTRILVDTGPDMREQLLAANVSDIDAVIWTHDHADHSHGLDDLRQLYQVRGRPVICYARPWTLSSLAARFAYAFEGHGGYPASVEGRAMADKFKIGDIEICVVDQPHGAITSAGLSFHHDQKNIVYSTDFNVFTPEIEQAFIRPDVWVVDALRERPHPSHANLPSTLAWIARVRPGLAVLTHMDQSMDYATLAATLPAGVIAGYDGMEITV
jgi:phosphoribosyl 1,2-cyclic phosphate phosphodiesterase